MCQNEGQQEERFRNGKCEDKLHLSTSYDKPTLLSFLKIVTSEKCYWPNASVLTRILSMSMKFLMYMYQDVSRHIDIVQNRYRRKYRYRCIYIHILI